MDYTSKSPIQGASVGYYTITKGKENIEASVTTDSTGKFFVLTGGKYKGVNCPPVRMCITKYGYHTYVISPSSTDIGNIYLEKE